MPSLAFNRINVFLAIHLTASSSLPDSWDV